MPLNASVNKLLHFVHNSKSQSHCYLFYHIENHLSNNLSLNNFIQVLHEEIRFIPYYLVFQCLSLNIC